MISWLRDARWLDATRARAYATMLAVAMALALLFSYVSDYIGHHPGAPPPIAEAAGKPQPNDFLAFWSAARLASQGQPQTAYDLNRLAQLERQTAALDPKLTLAFFYPPPFLLLCLPFAALSYFTALLVFVGLSGVALLLILRRILPAAWGWLPALSFPGLLMNAATGQNGFVSAACLAAPLLLQTRPFLAGLCLGCLVIKPHLAICVPFILAAAGAWRAMAGAATAAAALLAASWIAFGTSTWIAFLHLTKLARVALEDHQEDWGKLQSLYTSFRLLGAPLWAAYLAQILLTVAVMAAAMLIARRRPQHGAIAALIAAAAVLCAPHVLDYDLAVTGAPLAWIAQRAARTGWLPWEKLLAASVFVWPLGARIATANLGLAIGPLILLALFGLVARRALQVAA